MATPPHDLNVVLPINTDKINDKGPKLEFILVIFLIT